jgi:hypothetical protein
VRERLRDSDFHAKRSKEFTCRYLQWASSKTRTPYDFSSYVGRIELDI